MKNNFQKTLQRLTEQKAQVTEEVVYDGRMNPDFQKFFDAYATAALFSSNDESDESGGQPMDSNYSAEDIAPETLRQMQKDCSTFFQQQQDLIKDNVELAGHDFWLTRNGHGAGFWDGDWPEDIEQILTLAAHRFGEFNLYIGDDGMIYGS